MSDKPSIVRWGRVIPVLVTFVVLFVLLALFLDPFAKWALVRGGQAVFGARVDVESVRITLRKSSIRIAGLEIADKSEPMKNLFQWSESVMDLRALPMLEKKVIIEHAAIKGLKFGSPRKTSGALLLAEKRPGFVGKAMDRVWSQVESIGLDKFEGAKKYYDPKTVVNPDALSTYKAADQAKTFLTQSPSDIQKQFDNLKAEDRAKAIQARIQALGQGGSDPAAILKKAEEVKTLQSDIQSLRADIGNSQKLVTDRLQQAQAQLEAVKKAKEDDWAKIRSTLSLPTLDKSVIARAVFGPKVAQWLERGLNGVQTARQYMPAKPLSPPPPPRGRSRTIEYPKLHDLPRFLLVKAELSGEVGQESPFAFTGTLEGITTNPPLYGKPVVVRLQGEQGSRSFTTALTVDHTKAEPSEALAATYNGIALRQVGLGQEGSLGMNLADGTGRVQGNVNVRGDELSGNVHFVASNLTVEPKLAIAGRSDIGKRLTDNLTSSLSKVKSLDAGITLGGTLTGPTMAIESNLGGIIAASLKQAVGAEVEQQEKTLRAELDRVTSAKLQVVQSQVDGLKNQYLPKLASQNKLIDDLLNQLKAQATRNSPVPGADKPLDTLKGIFGR